MNPRNGLNYVQFSIIVAEFFQMVRALRYG